jgi:hypothetical protein
MTLSSDLRKRILKEAEKAHALLECKSMDDFAESTLQPLGVKKARVFIDGGWAMQVACSVIKSKLSQLDPNGDGECTEADLQQGIFGVRTFEYCRSPLVTEVDVVFDAGTPPCKLEECQDRSKDHKKRGIRPYGDKVNMADITNGIRPEDFAHSKHLYKAFFARALDGKAFTCMGRTLRVDTKDGVHEGTAEKGWTFTEGKREHLEADLQIPHLMEQKSAADANVVVATDGDFFTLLLLLLNQRAGDGLARLPLFLYLPAVGKNSVPQCVHMNLLYKYWLNAHGNVMTLCAAHLFTKTDIAPFRKKVIFKGIGDGFVIDACFAHFAKESNVVRICDNATFAQTMLELYRRAKDLKGASARTDYESTEAEGESKEWKAYVRRHCEHFLAALLYWSRETKPAVANAWLKDIKRAAGQTKLDAFRS